MDAAGIDPREIPEKIWFPALSAASLEDEETLQDKWASLLANAANAHAPGISVQFPRILANLSTREAAFLDLYFDQAARRFPTLTWPLPASFVRLTPIEAGMAAVVTGTEFRWKDDEEEKRTLEHLVSEGLMQHHQVDMIAAAAFFSQLAISSTVHPKTMYDLKALFTERYGFTLLGAEFVMACRPPHMRPCDQQADGQ